MTPDEKLNAIFRAARAGDAAPEASYGFETRLLARIRADRQSTFYGIALRLSPIFAALVVAAVAWGHSFLSFEADATYAWDALRSGPAPVVSAWLDSEGAR